MINITFAHWARIKIDCQFSLIRETVLNKNYIAPIERSAKLRESSERRDYGHEKTMDRQGKARDSA